MYVCICNAITDRQIREAVDKGVTNVSQLQSKLGVASGCGSCMDTAAKIIQESRQRPRIAGPVLYRPALA
jgi:bacterioferritin-associated ferredoxin